MELGFLAGSLVREPPPMAVVVVEVDAKKAAGAAGAEMLL